MYIRTDGAGQAAFHGMGRFVHDWVRVSFSVHTYIAICPILRYTGTDQRLDTEIPPHSAPGGVRDGICMLQIVRFQIPHQKIAERALPDGCQPVSSHQIP